MKNWLFYVNTDIALLSKKNRRQIIIFKRNLLHFPSFLGGVFRYYRNGVVKIFRALIQTLSHPTSLSYFPVLLCLPQGN